MAAHIFDQVESSYDTNPPLTVKKRTRRTHPKVRTGCITCKIRRKKCDETRPHCQRCTSTGRKCDGYIDANVDRVVAANTFKPARSETTENGKRDPVQQEQYVHDSDSPSSSITDLSHVDVLTVSECTYIKEHRRRNVRPDVQTTIHLARAPNVFPSAYAVTDLENHCFSYFRYRTGPQLASYFASTIWQKYCTNLGLSHPVVFACGAALGAVHRRFDLGISAEALQWCAHSDRLIKNARELLTAFERDVRNQNFLVGSRHWNSDSVSNIGTNGYGIENNDILMAAYMLLFTFESFQADFSAAVFNLTIGIKYLLLRPMKLLHSQTSYPDLNRDPEVVVEFFGRIRNCAKELFGSEEKILTVSENGGYGVLPSIPPKFISLEQARDYILTEVHHILHTPDQVWRSKASRITTRIMHTSRLLRWSAAYTETVLCMNRTETEKRAGSVLRVTRSLAYLLLYFALRLTADTPGNVEGNTSGLGRSDLAATETYATPSQSGLKQQPHPGSKGGESGEKKAGLSSTTTFTASSIWKAASQQEDLMSYFYRLQIWADMFLDPTNPFRHGEHGVSFDSGVGPPLDPLPSPKSSGKTRFIVKYGMDRSAADLEDTDASGHLGIYGVAEQSSAIEEHAVIEAVRARMPPGMELGWVDVTLFAEDRKLLLQYCCNGPVIWDEKPRWVQEWWIF